jgi:hypothetical protein
VWAAAANRLWHVHCAHQDIPLDPELFVASQPLTDPFVDPWSSLTNAAAGRRYLRRVRVVIRLLQAELKSEIRRAEARIQSGNGLSKLVRAADTRISPLALYIAAHRAGCPDLAQQLRLRAIEQHNCCPLYRSASLLFIPPELYPVGDFERRREFKEIQEVSRKITSLN